MEKDNQEILSKDIIIKKLKEIKPFLYEHYHVSRIGFFGSFALGNNKDNSDIDILVNFEKPIGWEFFDIEDLLYKQFKRKIDLVSFNALKSQLKEKIINQTIFI